MQNLRLCVCLFYHRVNCERVNANHICIYVRTYVYVQMYQFNWTQFMSQVRDRFLVVFQVPDEVIIVIKLYLLHGLILLILWQKNLRNLFVQLNLPSIITVLHRSFRISGYIMQCPFTFMSLIYRLHI